MTKYFLTFDLSLLKKTTFYVIVFFVSNGLLYSQAIPPTFDISTLNGTNGFNMLFEGDMAFGSLTNAGDINGDGIEDLIVTDPSEAPNNFQNSVGRAYVVFGTDNGLPGLLNLGELDGTNGFYINGFTEPLLLGTDVSGLGDINGDGVDDFIISSAFLDSNDNSSIGAYVFFGRNDFPIELDPTSLDGTNGFKVLTRPSAGVGPSVTNGGDINGDGFNDILLGDNSVMSLPGIVIPKIYVLFGGTNFPSTVVAQSLQGDDGFVFEADINFLGTEIAGGGDINNDGVDDIIIGSSDASYIIYGKSSSFDAKLVPEDLNGSNGFSIVSPGNTFFSSLSFLKDVNNDGINDLALGIQSTSQTAILFGKAGGFGVSFDLNTLDGSNGFVVNGVNSGDDFGFDVENVDDFNGDGISDIIIYADDASGTTQPIFRSYIIYGRDDFPLLVEASSLDGSNGFAFNAGIRALGGTLTSLDIDNDGLSDIASVSFVNLSSVIFGTNATTPYFTNVIDNQSTTENSNAIVIDLNDRVTDDDSDDNLITFEVTSNTNSSLVSTSIENNILTITPLQDQIGETDITLTATSDGLQVKNRFKVSIVEAPLYEQTGFSNTNNSFISQIFTDLGGAVESADNFTIPDGEIWTLERVTVDAVYTGNKSENGIIIIYEDNNGSIGDVIYTSSDIPIAITEIPVRFSLSLPSSLELESGVYWISVQAKQDFNPQQNRWFWGYAKPAINQDFQIQDTNQLLGENSPTSYTISNRDGALVFALYGENSGASLSTENEELKKITLYPNPFSENLNIDFPNELKIETISIFNSLGQEVFQTDNLKRSLNLKSLESGVYLLKVTSQKKTASFKIIKQ